jgi:hypothetical protein
MSSRRFFVGGNWKAVRASCVASCKERKLVLVLIELMNLKKKMIERRGLRALERWPELCSLPRGGPQRRQRRR